MPGCHRESRTHSDSQGAASSHHETDRRGAKLGETGTGTEHEIDFNFGLHAFSPLRDGECAECG